MPGVIEAIDLTRVFGAITAVDRVSFEVREGEIFGFLGPNGAGKTTTTRMLTGVIPMDGGSARIFGHDIMKKPVQAKQRFGNPHRCMLLLGNRRTPCRPPTNVPSNIMMLSPLLKFPLVFISGIFVPLEQMLAWGLILAACSPLTYFTDIVRYSFTGAHYFPVPIDIGALAGFALAFTAAAMHLHRRSMPRRM
ncbi:MAG: type transport system permease protein [Methanoculleus sp.]|nr:type transport system permease protein [Methanoculleus sp.]MDK2990422.1 type transport system permease protein [Methanoculleus sp.]